MRQAKWGFLAMACGLSVPVAGIADQALIRIEARRAAAEAATAAAGWAARLEDPVVTLALPSGWTGIAIGPLEADAARARLAALKARGAIPEDSYVTTDAATLTLVPVAEDGPSAPVPAASVPDAGSPSDGGPSNGGPSNGGVADSRSVDDAAGPAAPATGEQSSSVPGAADPSTAAPAPALSVVQLESFQDRAEADAALPGWRSRFPSAAIRQLPTGWFALTVGPFPDPVARSWVGVLREAKVIPSDAVVTRVDEAGQVLVPGTAETWGAPGPADAQMPPLEEVQRALRWAGLYEGAIDGKSGPKTRDAIRTEILRERLAPDEATAMHRLIDRRAEWRDGMNLQMLEDRHTGLRLLAPMDRLQFDRTERALSIYAPRDGSGAALILFSQPGGQQELLDLSGLITALGWVPAPDRTIRPGHVLLHGRDDDHIGHAEGWVRDGRAEGYVLIWPAADAETQPRMAAEISDSLSRVLASPAEDASAADAPGDAPDAGAAGPDGPPAGQVPAIR